MDDFLDTCYLEYEIANMKIDDMYEWRYSDLKEDQARLLLEASINDQSITDSKYISIMESKASEFGKTVVKAIKAIIKGIIDFITKIKTSFINFLNTSKAKKQLTELEKSIISGEITPNQTVQIYADNKKDLDNLNEYIREMSKLERELRDLKLQNKLVGYKRPDVIITNAFEVEKIMEKMDLLNNQFDNKLIQNNSEVIDMALDEALRYSKKSLDNIKLDYENIQEGSDKILQVFIKDTEGIEHPLKMNAIQKMAASISEKTRKTIYNRTKKTGLSIKTLLSVKTAILAGAGGYLGYNTYKAIKTDSPLPITNSFMNIMHAKDMFM